MQYEVKDVFFSGNKERLRESINEFLQRAYELKTAVALLNETYHLNDIAFAIIKGDSAITPEDALRNALSFKQAFEAQYETYIEIENPKHYGLLQQEKQDINYTLLEKAWYKAVKKRKKELAYRIDGVIGLLHPFKSESEREGFDNAMFLLAYIASLENKIMPSDNKPSDFEKLKNLYHSILKNAYSYVEDRSKEYYNGKYGKELQEVDEKRLIKMLANIAYTGTSHLKRPTIKVSQLDIHYYPVYKEELLNLIKINASALRHYSNALDEYTLAKSEKLISIKQQGLWKEYIKAKKEELNLLMQQDNQNHGYKQYSQALSLP